MDDGRGNLVEISKERAEQIELAVNQAPLFCKADNVTLKSGIFRLGEKVEIKGSWFQITNIGRHTLTLRLLIGKSNENSSKI